MEGAGVLKGNFEHDGSGEGVTEVGLEVGYKMA